MSLGFHPPSVLQKSFPRTILLRSTFFVMCYCLTAVMPSYANTLYNAKGLPLLTEEELTHIETTWPEIVDAHPNKIGKTRIKRYVSEQGLHSSEFAELHSLETNGQELELSQMSPPFIKRGLYAGVAGRALVSAGKSKKAPLPRSVDNSHWPSFPVIGNQQSLSSCVAWASTYYQASHEIGMINGYNNKTNLKGVLSPKWTYNILNNGVDQGLRVLSAYQLLAQNGAPSILNFPYDSNFLQWDLNLNDWIAAISSRTTPAQIISGINQGTTETFNLIKTMLNNGHVLTFGTYIDSWIFTKVKKDPSNPKSPKVGEMAAAWLNGSYGPHMMTIVGYDDDIWIDVNGNGKVDPGEKGAFLVANTWGNKWGNSGFVWIAYDAFRDISAVPSGPSKGRVAAGAAVNSNLISIAPIAPNYKPRLIAEFSLTQSLRNQVAIAGGVSNISNTTPTSTYKSSAIAFQGGNYEFSGAKTAVNHTATFALDLTDLLIAGGPTADQRFYLIVSDNTLGDPTTLTSFSLVDRVHDTRASCSNLPVVCDNSVVSPYIDYQTLLGSSIDTTPPVVNLTYPVEGQIVKGSIDITVHATDDHGVACVELYIDGTLYQTDTTLPYLFTVDTTHMKNGMHHLTAMAYDTSDNSATSSIIVHVQN